jgi:cytochrome c-type biogenesis protein CcmH
MSWPDSLFITGAIGLAAVPVFAIAKPLWRHARLAAWGLPLVLVSAAITTYLAVGRPGMWGARVVWQQPAPPSAPASASAPTDDVPPMANPQVQAMVERLAERLQRNPDDPAGWRMLVRSYETLNRFDEAVLAWQRLFQLNPPDADQLTEYAVTLGMARGQRLAGEPEAVLEQALKIAPGHVQALALLGSAAFERHDYPQAIARWEALMRLASHEDDVRQRIGTQIARARELLERQSVR